MEAVSFRAENRVSGRRTPRCLAGKNRTFSSPEPVILLFDSDKKNRGHWGRECEPIGLMESQTEICLKEKKKGKKGDA